MPFASRVIWTAGIVVCLATAQELPTGWKLAPAGKQIALDTWPMATALSRDGKSLYVLHAGAQPGIAVIGTGAGAVTSRVPVADAWLGMVLSPAGDRLYVAGASRGAVYEFSVSNAGLAAARTFELIPADRRGNQDFFGDLALSPDGRMLYVTDLYRDSVVVVNPQSGMPIQRIKTGRRPYRILFHPDGKSFFVSHWADGTVGHYDTATGSALGPAVRLGAHPTDMVWRAGGPVDPDAGAAPWTGRLFVAAANTNSVYAIGVTAGKELRLVDSIHVGMWQQQPLGMTPSGLALAADGNRLYVACSGANAAAVVDVSGDRGFVEGFIPTGAYPTALRALAGGTVAVMNGRSASASWIDNFTPAQLDAWTKTAMANTAFRVTPPEQATPVPAIQHVIYIVRDGRAEDGPNQRKLAREFATFDNFRATGDTAADGYNWSTAAIAPDYVEKLGPAYAAGRRKVADFEAQDPASLPPAGYLWTSAAIAGVTVHNFGHMANNRPAPQAGQSQVATVRDPVLAKSTNLQFRGPDAAYPDVERAKVFAAELAEWEKSGNMPRLVVVRLSAASDQALGMIAEAVSKSRFWGSSLIAVADTTGAADSHRASALLISPFVKRGVKDSAAYNTLSLLRTLELLLGLRPMTHFDAGAFAMTAALQTTPDPSPYVAEGGTK